MRPVRLTPGSEDLIRRRLEAREDHFLDPSRLASQFEALEPPADAVRVHEIYEAVRSKRASGAMRFPVISVSEDADVDAAANKVVIHKIDHLRVVRDGAPVGTIARHDLLLLLT